MRYCPVGFVRRHINHRLSFVSEIYKLTRRQDCIAGADFNCRHQKWVCTQWGNDFIDNFIVYPNDHICEHCVVKRQVYRLDFLLTNMSQSMFYTSTINEIRSDLWPPKLAINDNVIMI